MRILYYTKDRPGDTINTTDKYARVDKQMHKTATVALLIAAALASARGDGPAAATDEKEYVWTSGFWKDKDCRRGVAPAVRPCTITYNEKMLDICVVRYVPGATCDGKADADWTGDWTWTNVRQCTSDAECSRTIPPAMEPCMRVECQKMRYFPETSMCVAEYRRGTRCDGRDPGTDRTEDDPCIWDEECAARYGQGSTCSVGICLVP